MSDPRNDAALLRDLRDGDGDAYVALWQRHVGAAFRYANRMLPSRAEDLVSESFLAIYQQVTTTTKGPQFAFRSYLKTVMRNTAIRWRRESDHVVDSDETEPVDRRDALSFIEAESDAADVLDSLRALPERWQQVLWMAEIAEAPRTEIAATLDISPNAVSALQRRARTGLKFQWLSRQVPPALRDDTAHTAWMIPRYLTDASDAQAEAQMVAHIAECALCSELLHSMRGSAARLQGVSLSALGLGALGATIPAGSLSSGTAIAAIVATGAGAGLLGGLLSGGVGVLTVGGVVLASWLHGALPTDAHPVAVASPAVVAAAPTAAPSAPAPAPTETAPDAPGDGVRQLGRGVQDPTIEIVDLDALAPEAMPEPPERPEPITPVPVPQIDPGTDAGTDDPDGEGTDPEVPVTEPEVPVTEPEVPVTEPEVPVTEPEVPVTEPEVPVTEPEEPVTEPEEPVTEPEPEPEPEPLTAGVSTPAGYSGYLAPVIAGRSAPDATVIVQLDGQQYRADSASDGTWSFDPRGLQLSEGTYEYLAWATTESEQSLATAASFTVLPIVIEGFEDLTGFEDMQVAEARTTGIVIAATGPANGTIFVTSMQGQSAMFTLDATGHATKRLRMDSRGWYWFTFRALDADGFWGPAFETAADVYDPEIIFDPWGPNPDEMTFDFTDPETEP